MTVYLDASALVKLAAPEEETEAVLAFLAGHRSQATSVVALVEVRRVVARRPGVAPGRVDDVLGRTIVLGLEQRTIDAAATVGPATLRTLDAIHLASAVQLGEDLEAFVTFDRRLADAATALGMPVASPGA